jgi:hypothetical protein
MTKHFKIDIASPPDREKLVADIFFGTEQWAELNQEDGVLKLEVYPRRDGRFWELSLAEVVEALNEAKKGLTGE